MGCRVAPQTLVADYVSGMSLPEVAAKHGLHHTTVRHHVSKAGALRTRADGVRLAGSTGKLSASRIGKSRQFSPEHCAAISRHRRAWADENARGIRITPKGYAEYTRGEHAGRSVHVVTMEERIGRRLRADENVHHIDGNKLNNDENNLALVTKAGHGRLHRREDALSGKSRRKSEDGRFC